MDRISVAMATYNGERFLREQLDSLYKQTRVPDEIVVTDDCSSDNTAEILEEYHIKFGLKYILNHQSLGVNKNFEKAIRACSGDYIMICDQDDEWFPEKVEVSYKKIKEIEGELPAMVTSQCYHINGIGSIISKKKNQKKDTYTCADTILQLPGLTQGCSILFNRKLLEILRPFPSNSICMYDVYIGFTCACVGIKYNMSNVLMYYRHHDKNVTAPIALNNRKSIRKVISDVIWSLDVRPLPRERKRSLLLISEEYGDMMKDSSKKVIHQLIQLFEEKNVLKRGSIILKFEGLSMMKKIKLILGEILYIKKLKT